MKKGVTLLDNNGKNFLLNNYFEDESQLDIVACCKFA